MDGETQLVEDEENLATANSFAPTQLIDIDHKFGYEPTSSKKVPFPSLPAWEPTQLLNNPGDTLVIDHEGQHAGAWAETQLVDEVEDDVSKDVALPQPAFGSTEQAAEPKEHPQEEELPLDEVDVVRETQSEQKEESEETVAPSDKHDSDATTQAGASDKALENDDEVTSAEALAESGAAWISKSQQEEPASASLNHYLEKAGPALGHVISTQLREVQGPQSIPLPRGESAAPARAESATPESAEPAKDEWAALAKAELAGPSKDESAALARAESAAPGSVDSATPAKDDSATPAKGDSAAPVRAALATPAKNDSAALGNADSAALAKADSTVTSKAESAAPGGLAVVGTGDHPVPEAPNQSKTADLHDSLLRLESQAPGEDTQAEALEAVANHLLLDTPGFSQEVENWGSNHQLALKDCQVAQPSVPKITLPEENEPSGTKSLLGGFGPGAGGSKEDPSLTVFDFVGSQNQEYYDNFLEDKKGLEERRRSSLGAGFPGLMTQGAAEAMLEMGVTRPPKVGGGGKKWKSVSLLSQVIKKPGKGHEELSKSVKPAKRRKNESGNAVTPDQKLNPQKPEDGKPKDAEGLKGPSIDALALALGGGPEEEPLKDPIPSPSKLVQQLTQDWVDCFAAPDSEPKEPTKGAQQGELIAKQLGEAKLNRSTSLETKKRKRTDTARKARKVRVTPLKRLRGEDTQPQEESKKPEIAVATRKRTLEQAYQADETVAEAEAKPPSKKSKVKNVEVASRFRKTKAVERIEQESNRVSTRKRSLDPAKEEGVVITESPSRRRKSEGGPVRVLFSHSIPKEIVRQQTKVVERLRGKVVTEVSECSHFIAVEFLRTKNMLEAIAAGKAIVTPQWLDHCGLASYFIDPAPHVLQDEKKEKELRFSLRASLASAAKQPLLAGRHVYITPKTKPNRTFFTPMVKSSGGQVVGRPTEGARCLVISCPEDSKLCDPLLGQGYTVYSTELLMAGVVRQWLELDSHVLFQPQPTKGQTARPVTRAAARQKRGKKPWK